VGDSDKILERISRIETLLEGNVPFSKVSISIGEMLKLMLAIIVSGVVPSMGLYYAVASKIDTLSISVNYHISDKRIHCEDKKQLDFTDQDVKR